MFNKVSPNDVIAVWFSCGAASAMAAKLTLSMYRNYADVRVVYNPVIEEDEDNFRFLKDVEKWLGIDIELAKNDKYPEASAEIVWSDRKFMSGPMGAPCTLELKKKARQQWEQRNNPDWNVLGFTYEEKKRHDRFVSSERDNVLPVLIDAEYTKQQCIDALLDAGIEPPRIYRMGYPNANCIGCVKASSPTYWNHVRKQHPEVFEKRAKQSREIGAKLAIVKGERIYLDELSPTAQGRALKSMDFDCGIFCEEGKT